MSIEITVDKIDNNIKQISSIVDLDLKQETKETLNELANKIGSIAFEGMNSLGDHKIPRLFYGTEDIMVFKEKKKKKKSFYWHFLSANKLVLNAKKTHLGVYCRHKVYIGNPSVRKIISWHIN
jgi:hypothetical protein